MSQREKENKVRVKWLEAFEKFLIEQGEDPMRVPAIKSASKANYGIMMPTLTSEGDEIVLRIEVSCCRKDVDPWALADEYRAIIGEDKPEEEGE